MYLSHFDGFSGIDQIPFPRIISCIHSLILETTVIPLPIVILAVMSDTRPHPEVGLFYTEIQPLHQVIY